MEGGWCKRESAFKDVRHTVPGTQTSWVRLVQEPQRKGSLHQMGPTGERDAGTHNAGSLYKACDIVIVPSHYEVTCSDLNLTIMVHTYDWPTPRRQSVSNEASCLRV